MISLGCRIFWNALTFLSGSAMVDAAADSGDGIGADNDEDEAKADRSNNATDAAMIVL